MHNRLQIQEVRHNLILVFGYVALHLGVLILFYFTLQWMSLFSSEFMALKHKSMLICTLYRMLKLNVLKHRARIVSKRGVCRSLLVNHCIRKL